MLTIIIFISSFLSEVKFLNKITNIFLIRIPVQTFRYNTEEPVNYHPDFNTALPKSTKAEAANKLEEMQITKASKNTIAAPLDMDMTRASNKIIAAPLDMDMTRASNKTVAATLDMEMTSASNKTVAASLDMEMTRASNKTVAAPLDMEMTRAFNKIVAAPLDMEMTRASSKTVAAPLDMEMTRASNKTVAGPLDIEPTRAPFKMLTDVQTAEPCNQVEAGIAVSKENNLDVEPSGLARYSPEPTCVVGGMMQAQQFNYQHGKQGAAAPNDFLESEDVTSFMPQGESTRAFNFR